MLTRSHLLSYDLTTFLFQYRRLLLMTVMLLTMLLALIQPGIVFAEGGTANGSCAGC